jgi:hypothetical protein
MVGGTMVSTHNRHSNWAWCRHCRTPKVSSSSKVLDTSEPDSSGSFAVCATWRIFRLCCNFRSSVTYRTSRFSGPSGNVHSVGKSGAVQNFGNCKSFRRTCKFGSAGRWEIGRILETEGDPKIIDVLVGLGDSRAVDGREIRGDSGIVGGPRFSAEFACGSSFWVLESRFADHKNVQRKCTHHAAVIWL